MFDAKRISFGEQFITFHYLNVNHFANDRYSENQHPQIYKENPP